MSWMVYILKCADGTLYTGITMDLTHRIKAHGTGKVRDIPMVVDYSNLYIKSSVKTEQKLSKEKWR